MIGSMRLPLSFTLTITLIFAFSLIGHASSSTDSEATSSLRQTSETWSRIGHEPNTFGYSWDSEDESHIEINLSLKWSPYDDGIEPGDNRGARKNGTQCANNGHWRPCLYLAFSTTQSFYWPEDKRTSSPVIGRRFNPEIFWRFWQQDGGYIDVSFNHESNGQSIETMESFNAKVDEVGTANLANEYVSRGWDYWEITLKDKRNGRFRNFDKFAYYLNLRYFMSDGYLQDEPEELRAFEGDFGFIERKDVDGLNFLASWNRSDKSFKSAKIRKLSYEYNTGIASPFKNDLHRLEIGVNLGSYPFTLFFSEGYNSDLTDYFRRVKNYGIYIDLYDF